MGIFNYIKERFSGNSKVLHTPYGNFNLAKKSDIRRLKKQVIELQRTTDALTRKDIRNWRNAWQLAINVDSPNRQALYDIYRDVDIDLHLTGCIGQRKGFVMARSFKLVDEKVKRMKKHFTILIRPGSNCWSVIFLTLDIGGILSLNWGMSPLMATDVSATMV